jgi:hypothetical protein
VHTLGAAKHKQYRGFLRKPFMFAIVNKSMKNTISIHTAKKLLITGSILWIISALVSLIVLWNVYGQAGASFSENKSNNSAILGTLGVIASINVYFAYLSYVLLGLSLLIFIISKLRTKR